MYAFVLGREFKLSIAEIFTVFPKADFVSVDKNVAIVANISESEILSSLPRMGGIIKCVKLSADYRGKPEDIILTQAEKHERKFAFGLSVFGESSTKQHLMRIKKHLKAHDVSVRFVNKNFANLSSAQIIGEKLVSKSTDYSVFVMGNTEYFGSTIWVQDIDAYSARDYGKTRDMIVGMLPPKLAQMMMNLSEGSVIYDPFCGLGTVLIESMIAQNTQVYGSDISPENVEKTKQNINYARKNLPNKVKTAEAFVLDARGISSSPVLKKSDAIVTEGYLGQVFQKYSVTESKISEEKVQLLDIYTKFFEGLSRANYKGIVVISFPFWEIKGKYFYFDEVYQLIQKHAKNLPLLPKLDDIKHTRSGSLLYKRPDQVVGREIFKLKIR